MKKHFFLIALSLALLTNLNAQDHQLAIGAGLGASFLTGDLGENGSFGINYSLEGKYFLTDQLPVGLEYTSHAIGYGDDSSLFGVSAYGATIVLAKAEYIPFSSKVTPYAGFGIGIARIETPEITFTNSDGTPSTIPSEGKTNLALSPKAGLALGNFKIEFAYNIAGKTPETEYINVEESDQPFNPWNLSFKYIYPFEL